MKYQISIYAITRAKRKVLTKINDNHVDQYGKVWKYENKLLKVMTYSTIFVMTEEQELADGRKRFKGFYTCYGLLKKGFRAACMPFLGLNGGHLKGPYGGKLLGTVVTNGNDDIYPVAWVVVEAENSDTSNWF